MTPPTPPIRHYLTAATKDAARVVRLAPGDYTVVAQAAPNDPGGTALIEIYFFP